MLKTHLKAEFAFQAGFELHPIERPRVFSWNHTQDHKLKNFYGCEKKIKYVTNVPYCVHLCLQSYPSTELSRLPGILSLDKLLRTSPLLRLTHPLTSAPRIT